MYATINQKVRRNDNGRTVRIVCVLPTGPRVFYVTEDTFDGHTCILSDRDIRPLTEESKS